MSIKFFFTAPTAEQPLFTNVKVVTDAGIKTLKFNGEYEGRGKVPAYFWSRDEMIEAVKKVLKS